MAKFNSKIADYLGDTYLENRFADKQEAMQHLNAVNLKYPKSNKSGMGGMPMFIDGNLAYVDNSEDHNLIIGTTGSMKSRAAIMPLTTTLGMCGENIVLIDPKGEIFDKTSGYFNSLGYKIKKIDFRNMNESDSFNPMFMPYQLIRNSKNKDDINLGKSMLNDLAAVLTDGKKGKSEDPFWYDTSKELLDGLLAHLTYTCENINSCNLMNLKPLLTEVSKPVVDESGNEIDHFFKYLLESFPETYSPRQKIYHSIKLADRTKSCVISYVNSYISPFIANKQLEKILSNNTIDLKDLAKDDEKMILYIIVPDEKTTYNAICSIIVKQTYNILIHEAENKAGRKLTNRVNFIMDEFANIPKIPDMSNMISAARSRNIRWHLVLQCNSQLISKYGNNDASTIKNNCQNWIYLNSREKEVIDEVINLIGEDKSDPKNTHLTSVDLMDIKKRFPFVKALVINKNGKPFVTELWDISLYKNIMKDVSNPIYKPCDKKTDKSKFEPYLFFKVSNKFHDEPKTIIDVINIDNAFSETAEVYKDEEPRFSAPINFQN